MRTFATFLQPEIPQTSRPAADDALGGFSLPYVSQVRAELAKALASYPALSARSANLALFAEVPTAAYLDQLQALAAGQVREPYPQLSIDSLVPSAYHSNREI